MDIKCSKCGKGATFDAVTKINVGEDPFLKEKVKDGSLFIHRCPECGNVELVLYPAVYHDPEEHVLIWLLPDGFVPEDKVEALGREISAQVSSLGEYVFRRVRDVGSLIEKINVFAAGLDDVTMEMCKYVIKMETAENKGGETDLSGVVLRFSGIEGADNDLVFSFPTPEGMRGLGCGFNVYEDCAAIISRNPAICPEDGFATVDYDWITSFFK